MRGDRVEVHLAVQQVLITWHHRTRRNDCWIFKVRPVPKATLTTTFAGQVGTDPSAAPLKRAVVDEFAWLAVFAIAFRLGNDRANHLRMAVVAAFGNIDVSPGQFQRRVGFDRGNRRHVGANQEGRNQFEQRGDHHGRRRQHRELHRQTFPAAMPIHLCPDIQLLAEVQKPVHLPNHFSADWIVRQVLHQRGAE